MGDAEYGSWNAKFGRKKAEWGNDWKSEVGRRKKTSAQRAWYLS
jgi:hypothetical protein